MINNIPQDLIDTTIDILEARRNPKLNPKIGPYTKLKQYIHDPQVYISFTRIDMVGINPTSEFDTPLGIYVYPLQASWENYEVEKVRRSRKIRTHEEMTSDHDAERKTIMKAFPFGSTYPYIQVVRAKSPLTDLQEFNKRDLIDAMSGINTILRKANADESAIRDKNDLFDKIDNGTADPLVNTPGGIFWWLTMMCCDDGLDIGKTMERYYRSNKTMRVWNYLLRELGHDGFIDKGDSIIHGNEPTQAVFLHSKAFRHISTIENDPSVRSKKKEKKYSWMNYNTISDDARYTYDGPLSDTYTWHSGTFLEGTWKGGTWEGGTFRGETWEDGLWKNGTFEGDRWEKGMWVSGIWKGGTWVWGIIMSNRFNKHIISNVNPNEFYRLEEELKHFGSQRLERAVAKRTSPDKD